MVVFSCVALPGCIQKTIYPAILLTVVSVTPFELRPTAPTGSATITLPSVVVALRSDVQMPANLVAYSFAYETNLGSPLPQLAVGPIPIELSLTVGGTTNITLNPYTQTVVDLFSNTTSEISPIKATILLDVKDVNENTVRKEAHCLLYRPN